MLFSRSFLFTALAVLAPTLGLSAPVTPSPTLSIGSYTFNNFGCSLSSGGVFSTPMQCSSINVNTITQPGTGIQFSSGFTAAPGSFNDAVLTYNVSSTMGIDHIGLDFDGSTWFGFAVASVSEKVYNNNTQVGFGSVNCTWGLGCVQHDTIDLSGSFNNLYVEKDVYVGSYLGVAETSVIDQTFAEAPEPSSFAMFGAGALALTCGLVRRRRMLGQKA
jgi:hypothetical protein